MDKTAEREGRQGALFSLVLDANSGCVEAVAHRMHSFLEWKKSIFQTDSVKGVCKSASNCTKIRPETAVV